LNGDWYGSQADTTITNHYRLGTGTGNERGLLDRYQTDYGYRWTMGLSDASSGAQFYQLLDELNSVYRLSIGQYNHGQSSTNNQTVINAAGTGAVVLNGSSNAGTGGVIFGSGGPASSTVASINNSGNAQFNGTLQVSGASTFSNSTTVKNQTDSEIDSILWAGATANQKESFIYKDYSGASQWYMVKDASNNWALNSATGGLDSFKAYQSNNSGDTYINASNGSGHIRMNYESGAGSETDIYSGPNATLVAAFLGNAAIKFPGLAPGSGHNCLQIDNSGYISNTGSACASGGMNGTVNTGNAGQVAYYAGNGTVIAGTTSVAVAAGGTGATTAAQALQNLGAQPALAGVNSDGSSGLKVAGNLAAGAQVSAAVMGGVNYASQYPGQNNNGIASTFADASKCGVNGCTVIADPNYASAEQPYSFNLYGNQLFPSSSFAHHIDQRKGYQLDLFHDPDKSPYTGSSDGHVEACITTSVQGFTGGSTGWTGTRHACHPIDFWYAQPGLNYGTTASAGNHGPGGWTTTVALPVSGIFNTRGISEILSTSHIKAGVGDSTNYLYATYYGGAVAGSDEGQSLLSVNGGEGMYTYAGTVTAGGVGATSIKTNCTADCTAPGDGRYVVDLTQGVTGYVTARTAAAGTTPGTFTVDISVPPSSFYGTLAADVKTPSALDIGKGYTDQTFTINSGAGNTGYPQVNDTVCFSGSFHEQAKIKTVNSGGTTGPWSVTIPLRMPHEANSWIMGGGCSFIDFTTNDTNPSGTQVLHFPVDIIGAKDAHTLVYRYFRMADSTGYFAGNVQGTVTVSITNTAGTLTFGGINYNNQAFYGQPVLTISNSTNPSFNGTCTNSVASPANYVLTCSGGTQTSNPGDTTASATVAIGTSQYGNTGFTLYPGAELLDMLDYNASTCAPYAAGDSRNKTAPCNDGTLTLEPNNVNWALGDSVENSHHYSSLIHIGRRTLYAYNPMNLAGTAVDLQLYGMGIGSGAVTSPTLNYAGHKMTNGNPASYYIWNGGTKNPPGGYALDGTGTWNYGLWMRYAPDPGGANVMYIGCPQSGCTDPAFGYNIFQVAGNGGNGVLSWTPNTKQLALSATGGLDLFYTPLLSPKAQSRTNGQPAFLYFNSIDSGAASHQWTISAPVTGGGFTLTLPQKSGTFAMTSDVPGTMVASGSSHAGGSVPDPGSIAGTTRFLREDASWQAISTAVFGASGSGHSTGVVPDPGSSAGNTRYLREDGTWGVPGATTPFPTVRNSNFAKGLTTDTTTAGAGNCSYTPSADGIYRLTNDIWVTATTATGGTITSWLSLDGVANVTSTNANAANNRSTYTVTGLQLSGHPISISSTYSPTGGTATYNFSCTIEQLQ
jgi:hypothetical protein